MRITPEELRVLSRAYPELGDKFRAAADEIERLKPKWEKASKMMPPKGHDVLVIFNDGYQYILSSYPNVNTGVMEWEFPDNFNCGQEDVKYWRELNDEKPESFDDCVFSYDLECDK